MKKRTEDDAERRASCWENGELEVRVDGLRSAMLTPGSLTSGMQRTREKVEKRPQP